MSEQDDKTFLNRFSMVLAGLVVFAVIIAILAFNIHSGVKRGTNPNRILEVDARIKPIGAVYTSDNPAKAEEAPSLQADPAEMAATETPAAADGQAVYSGSCFACHDSGAAGAPKLSAEFWTDRLAKGEEALIAGALNGIGMMPPKGGNMGLSEEEIRASVRYMLAKIQE